MATVDSSSYTTYSNSALLTSSSPATSSAATVTTASSTTSVTIARANSDYHDTMHANMIKSAFENSARLAVASVLVETASSLNPALRKSSLSSEERTLIDSAGQGCETPVTLLHSIKRLIALTKRANHQAIMFPNTFKKYCVETDTKDCERISKEYQSSILQLNKITIDLPTDDRFLEKQALFQQIEDKIAMLDVQFMQKKLGMCFKIRNVSP